MIWSFVIACMFLSAEEGGVPLVFAVAAISENGYKPFNPALNHGCSRYRLDSALKDCYESIPQLPLFPISLVHVKETPSD